MDHYIEEYERKYRTKPITSRSGSDFTFLKDLVRQFGLEKSMEIVSQFLVSSNEWFKKKAHSLDVLRTNLNVVNTELASKAPERNPSSRKIIIELPISCEQCGGFFTWRGDRETLDGPAKRLCKKCTPSPSPSKDSPRF